MCILRLSNERYLSAFPFVYASVFLLLCTAVSLDSSRVLFCKASQCIDLSYNFTLNMIGSTFFQSKSNFVSHLESAFDVIIRKVYCHRFFCLALSEQCYCRSTWIRCMAFSCAIYHYFWASFSASFINSLDSSERHHGTYIKTKCARCGISLMLLTFLDQI